MDVIKMMNQSSFITIPLKSRCGKRVKSGHPWIFSNEIVHPVEKVPAGAIVAVQDDSDNFVGYATYNPHSLISLRILSREEDEFPGTIDWFIKKIDKAIQFRKRVYPERNSYRVVFSESDGLPGLVIDKYNDVLSVQIQTTGMENLVQRLGDALKQIFSPACIILRNTSDKRKLEGLSCYSEILFGEVPDSLIVEENGVQLFVDVKEGQKTGHFFDQADNRATLARFAQDSEVLDLFCYTGAWSLKLLLSGAAKATAIDSSKSAIEFNRRNAELNEFESNLDCIESDAFEWLSMARKQKKKFDIVIVDPPAFAKTAKQVKKALRGYEDLNRQAIHLIREGGILCSCSCSSYIGEDQFLKILQNAAARERKSLKILQIRGQAADHPILLSMPESRYLKCVIAIAENW